MSAGIASDPELVSLGVAWARGIGKVPVTCGDDTGFIVNRLLVPYLNDAARICGELQVDWSVADAAVRDELGHPMGPFELMDLIGLDVMVSAVQTMHRRFEVGSVRTCSCVARAGRGRLGWGANRDAGFFDYEEQPMSTVTITSSGTVATITLQRPESLNALDLADSPGATGRAHQGAR